MNRMIIELCEGIITGVYTNSMENYQVEVTEPDDAYDIERVADRKRLEHLISKGGMRDILNEGIPGNETSQMPSINPNVLVLVKDESLAKTKSGRMLQAVDAAYVDGYLTASAELPKFINKLFKMTSPDASLVYHCLKPLICQFDAAYNQMCQHLNEEAYDMIEEQSETK